MWTAGGLRRDGSSTLEIGDCIMDVSSLGSRERMAGVVGGLRFEFDGTGLRLIKGLFVAGVGIDVSDGLVRTDDIDWLSAGESGTARVFCTAEDGPDEDESRLPPPGRSFRAFAFTVSGEMCKAFRASIGISATPIIMLLTVPMSALPPPVIGSHGPSSTSYSTGRYLQTCQLPCKLGFCGRNLQLKVCKAQDIFLGQNIGCDSTKS
jgi:hypothetical protein